MINPLRLPDGLLHKIQEHVRRHGERYAESGGFLLGSFGSPLVTCVAFADGPGIERNRGGFSVSGKAMEILFAWAEEQDLRVWAQFHSHPTDAFLSATDLKYGFSVEGFTSAVIPDFVTPPFFPNQWGWWRYESKSWRAIDSPRVLTNCSVMPFVFNEDDIR